MASRPSYLQGRGRGRGRAGNGRGSPQASLSDGGRPGKSKGGDIGLGSNSGPPRVSYSKVTATHQIVPRLMRPDNGDGPDVNNGGNV